MIVCARARVFAFERARVCGRISFVYVCSCESVRSLLLSAESRVGRVRQTSDLTLDHVSFASSQAGGPQCRQETPSPQDGGQRYSWTLLLFHLSAFDFTLPVSSHPLISYRFPSIHIHTFLITFDSLVPFDRPEAWGGG